MGSIDLRLRYQQQSGADVILLAYANASWANASDRCSVSGYTWFYAGGLILHASKRQTIVALSSMEAEYIAATHVAQEGLWLRSLLTELCVSFPSPTPIYLDNSSAISLSTAARFHQHSKHIDTCYHFIRSHIDNGFFTLIWVPSHQNVTDILTKALARPAFSKFCLSLGLVSR